MFIAETRNNRLVLAGGSSSAGSAGQRGGGASPRSASWCRAGKDGDPGRDTLLSEDTELCASETFFESYGNHESKSGAGSVS